jgi:putative Mg2+ transporter-C (MgtC) family protein
MWEAFYASYGLGLSALLKLLLAILLGGAVGLEREFRGRPAGLRTHILVCLGATIIMIASASMPELYRTLSPQSRITIDPGRIAAGIVTGIGFLGAGAIMRIGDLIRGLTTAGCIWFVAALGIVIGQGFYALAIASTGVALIALLTLSKAEREIRPIVYRSIIVVGPLSQAESIEERCRAFLKEREIQVQDIATRFAVESERAEITFKIRTRNRLQSVEVVRAIASHPGLLEVRWV